MPTRLTLLFLFGCTLISNARADNWERFRGPNGNGIAKDKNIPVRFSATENVRWKATLAGDGNASPIVWGDRVFVHSSSLDGKTRSLQCLDVKTGDEVWKQTVPGNKVKFRADSSHASATPTTDGEVVYVPYWDGKDIILTAYRFKDGEKLWDKNLGEFVSQHGAGASPIIYKNSLIFFLDKDAYRDTAKKTGPVDQPSILYAFDKKTGKTQWEMPRSPVRACYSAPFFVERPGAAPEMIVTSTSAITSYDPDSGKSNWNFVWTFPNGALRTIAPATYIDGMLVACSGDGDGRRFMVGIELKGDGKGITGGQQTWGFNKNKETPYVPCPLVKGEHLYFVNDVGYAGCIHVKSGKRVWFERLTDPNIYASPVMIDGKIYAASEGGDVFVFDAEPTFKTPVQNVFKDTIRATPAVANGALYIRTKSHLYCIGGK